MLLSPCVHVCVCLCVGVCVCVSKTCNLQPSPPPYSPRLQCPESRHTATRIKLSRDTSPCRPFEKVVCLRVLQPLSSTIEFCSHHVSPFFLASNFQISLISLFSHLTRAMLLGMVARGMGRLWRLCVCLSAENHCSLFFILPVRVQSVWVCGGPIGLKTRCQLAVQGIGQNYNQSSLLQ
jgi:hypothetical protein